MLLDIPLPSPDMSRVRRICHYEEDSYSMNQQSVTEYHQSHHIRSEDGLLKRPPHHFSQGQPPQISFSFPGTTIDPFRHEALRQPSVDVAVNIEASKIFPSLEELQNVAKKYFNTIYQRFPIISKARFLERLEYVFSKPHADFTLLCLCIHLVLQYPSQNEQSMQSLLYVTIKHTMSLLESTSFLSLEVVQARLLITFYEIGHGIHPGASISIATAAKTARLLGLNKKQFQQASRDPAAKVMAEEEKRVWWATVNLDRSVHIPKSSAASTLFSFAFEQLLRLSHRFVNLCNGDSMSTTEDPQSTDQLPIDDGMWARNVILPNHYFLCFYSQYNRPSQKPKRWHSVRRTISTLVSWLANAKSQTWLAVFFDMSLTTPVIPIFMPRKPCNLREHSWHLFHSL